MSNNFWCEVPDTMAMLKPLRCFSFMRSCCHVSHGPTAILCLRLAFDVVFVLISLLILSAVNRCFVVETSKLPITDVFGLRHHVGP